ncbi:hypothetical protein LDENG_00268280, partial [Lucifuga dentata]
MSAVEARRPDSALLDVCADSEQPDSAEAARMLLYLMDSRRVQKLFVLDSMMALLEGLESAQQLLTQPRPPQPDGSGSRWKAVKAASRASEQQTEALLNALQDRLQQIHTKQHTLTQLSHQLHSKKQQSQELQQTLQKAQNALRVCDHQLTELRAESEAEFSHLNSFQRVRDELQDHISAVQSVMQISLLSFSQSELCVELRPRPFSSESSSSSSNELEPLKLSVTWSPDERFRLQVNEGAGGVVDECMSGRRSELSAALLEVMQTYMGQSDLLCEIQALRSSFAIDWRAAQRLLVYLKSAALVCHLQVEDGYPTSGRARLLSIRRDGQPVDTTPLQ